MLKESFRRFVVCQISMKEIQYVEIYIVGPGVVSCTDLSTATVRLVNVIARLFYIRLYNYMIISVQLYVPN